MHLLVPPRHRPVPPLADSAPPTPSTSPTPLPLSPIPLMPSASLSHGGLGQPSTATSSISRSHLPLMWSDLTTGSLSSGSHRRMNVTDARRSPREPLLLPPPPPASAASTSSVHKAPSA